MQLLLSHVSTPETEDIWRQLVLHYLITLALIMVEQERFILNYNKILMWFSEANESLVSQEKKAKILLVL